MSGEPLVLHLDDPRAQLLTHSGRKGASLAALRSAGLDVPDGFVITCTGSAYLVRTEPDQEPLRAEVAAAYDALAGRDGSTDPLVAVRSSAVAEDADSASAAGLLRTELGRHGLADVLAAARRCVLSADGVYRRYLGRAAAVYPPDLAVVVQLLVPATVAGVAFTANPVDGDRSTVVVEAVHGLGSTAVAGDGVPEHLQLTREGTVVLRRPGRAVAEDRVEGGEVRSGAPRPGVGIQVLTDVEAARVVRTALQVESVLGRPADVEWAMTGEGPVVVLQGRPVTTLG